MLTTWVRISTLPRRFAPVAGQLPRNRWSTSSEYAKSFGIRLTETEEPDLAPVTGTLKALETALDLRKFEIQLYWTRATYFWAFIAVAFSAFGYLRTNKEIVKEQPVLLLLVAGVCAVFSCGWFLSNAGSKQWQENWENHVDLLENHQMGPLLKILVRRPPRGPRPEDL